jgi:hypothetical protein
MGYHTEFEGSFQLDKPLEPEHLAYLKAFSETRRMKRLVDELENNPDPFRIAVGLPLGTEGAFFVGSTSVHGEEDRDPSILDGNTPPDGQPGLWCNWTPTDDGQQIIWNEGDPFYSYIEWLHYLIENFLHPWGYSLTGKVQWEGQDPDDYGVISIKNNEIEVFGPIIVTDTTGAVRRVQAFLCHASDDKPMVERLYNRLYEDGINPWLDKAKLLPGQDWKLEIARVVRNSDVVLVCLSHRAVNKIGFVQKEIKWALDVADEQPEGSIFIIPVKLEECEVPERLRQWQWLNLYEENGYDRLLLALRARADALTQTVDEE